MFICFWQADGLMFLDAGGGAVSSSSGSSSSVSHRHVTPGALPVTSNMLQVSVVHRIIRLPGASC